ncbi:Uncharacterised protein [Klebsiella pneumoniae]|nr:Uncharacterised protein [Klebsiella pneumoniae]
MAGSTFLAVLHFFIDTDDLPVPRSYHCYRYAVCLLFLTHSFLLVTEQNFQSFLLFLLLTPDAIASFGWRLLCLQFLIYSIYWLRWHSAP